MDRFRSDPVPRTPTSRRNPELSGDSEQYAYYLKFVNLL